jgi:predicted deacylase
MYRAWPGDPAGKLGERMVHLLWEGFVKHADAFVDIHSWSTFSTPSVTVDGKHRRSFELAKWTGYPYVDAIRPATHGYWKGHYDPKSDQMFMKVPRLGVPGFVIESTHVPSLGGWLVKENMETVKRALANLMKKMGMLAGAPDYSARSILFDMNETHVKPKKRGFLIPEAPLGTIFKKGDVVGRVYAIDTFELLETLKTPRAGCFQAVWPVAVAGPRADFAISLKDNFKVLKLT